MQSIGRVGGLSFFRDTGVCQLPDDLPEAVDVQSRVRCGDPEALYLQAVLCTP
jgi:hypothetical protein